MVVNIKQSEFEYRLLSEFRNPHYKGFRGVIVLDGICGIGKTTGIFQYLNGSVIKADPNNRVMYVGQYLAELNRVQEYFEEVFRQPKTIYKSNGIDGYVSKLNGLKKLILKNRHIAITHKLFESLDDECLELLKNKNYNLVIDEEPNVVQTLKGRYTYTLNNGKPKDLSSSDIEELIQLKAITLKGDTLIAQDFNLNRYSDFLKDVRNGKIKLYAQKREKVMENIYVWSQNPEVFKSFNTVHILTYLFSESFLQGYFNINNIPYLVENLTEQNFYETSSSHPFHQLIKLAPTFDESKFPDLECNPLSSKWFSRYKEYLKLNPAIRNILNTRIDSFFRQKGIKKEVKMWTTFKKHRQFLSNNGYKEAFVPFNVRAINDHRTKKHLVYAVNTYPNPIILNYFSSNNCGVSQDSFATSTLIQWIFRSQLRDGLPIKIFIPSNRMNRLLKLWVQKYKEHYNEAQSIKENFNLLSRSIQNQEPPTFLLNDFLKKQPGAVHIPWLVNYAGSL